MKKILLSFLLFCGVASAQDIVITEIMYNPPEAGVDSSEFIEFYNNGTTPVDLTDYTVTGIDYTFPSVTLNSGDYFVLAVNTSGFTNTYGFAPDGTATSGGLSNSGELIELRDNNGVLVDEVDYDDNAPWPSGFAAGEPDAGGASIRLCDVNTDNNDGNNWSTSTTGTGVIVNGFEIFATPGAASNCCSTVFGTDTQTACDSYTWIDNQTYTSDNTTATHTLTNAAGCDSIVTLNLTINNSTTGTDVQTACDSYTWIDNQTYTSDNTTATHTLTNAAGCDSIVTLNLTINNSTTGTDVQTACDSYTWIDNQTYTSDNTTATHTLTNAAGCDSIVTLNLTINNSTTGTDTQIACDSYTWIDGNTYTSDNNTATHTVVNAAGCDSIVTLDLTINSVSDITTSTTDLTITANAAGTTYQWIDCDNNNSPISGETAQSFTANDNGNYAVIITENGCADTSDCVEITTVGLVEQSSINFALYPNPTSGNLTIDFNTIQESIEIRVLSLTGQVIATERAISTNQVKLTVAEEPGIYLVEMVNQDNQKSVVRVVRQ